MASGKGTILRWLGGVALRAATETAVGAPAPRYLRFRLRGDVPRGEAASHLKGTSAAVGVTGSAALAQRVREALAGRAGID